MLTSARCRLYLISVAGWRGGESPSGLPLHADGPAGKAARRDYGDQVLDGRSSGLPGCCSPAPRRKYRAWPARRGGQRGCKPRRCRHDSLASGDEARRGLTRAADWPFALRRRDTRATTTMNSLTNTTMRHILTLAVLLGLSLTALAEDVRLQPRKDLNGYFPFTPPNSLREWEQRKGRVRRQILVAAGLWPMRPRRRSTRSFTAKSTATGNGRKGLFPERTAVSLSRATCTPKNIQGRVPGVMFAHGHRETPAST